MQCCRFQERPLGDRSPAFVWKESVTTRVVDCKHRVDQAQPLGCIQRAFPTLVFFNYSDSWQFLFSLLLEKNSGKSPDLEVVWSTTHHMGSIITFKTPNCIQRQLLSSQLVLSSRSPALGEELLWMS